MSEGPQARYRALVATGGIEEDPAQERALAELQRLYAELAAWQPPAKPSFLARFARKKEAPNAPPGVYVWGPVGRGKSMLMDLFYETAETASKRRVHFHAFMQDVHERIHQWREAEKRGEVKGGDPIEPVAEALAEAAKLLCFDEFQVEDIADASILGRLFEHLFELGVVVVATSNVAPDNLYQGGLNRHRFLPFIDLLKARLTVVELTSERDYRLDRLQGRPVYYSPLDAHAAAQMDEAFERLTDLPKGAPYELTVKGRKVEVPEAAKGVARFHFTDLCAKPLGAGDYLKISESFETVMIDDVPQLGPHNRNEAKRFVTLIDALYEGRNRLILSAAVPPSELYPEGEGTFQFQRTVSRLMEMQSADYLDALRAPAAE